ncbi:MAG: DUF1846 domain-containing protein [Lachnospiraceae bacterium]|nr:DUF1846 domain-containing protein [Lachnospiraceae bacterium]
MRTGFDNDKYLKIQSEHIKERISHFEGKLYLEFGGKLFDDYHASRVLPGFQPDSKLKMLLQLKDEAEVVIAICAEDIERNKKRGDLEIGYDEDVLRLIKSYRDTGLTVSSVVITRYTPTMAVEQIMQRIKRKKIKVYKHYTIEGYPNNIPLIMSKDGYGKNEYIETSRPLVIVTAPGPGSGKMATCLSQLYQDSVKGIKSGYAKFETFPVWNLPLKHPVNLAYEAATADLNDVNMIDPFHLAAYNETTVNYNRDVEIFPVLTAIFENIYGESPYKSPTDMGVNMVGYCITDDEACQEASKQEIIRRYFKACDAIMRETGGEKEKYKIELLMKQAGIDPEYRSVVGAARERAEKDKTPATAILLDDGRMITGGSTKLLGPSAAALLNALKTLAEIPHNVHVIAPSAIEPIQKLKIDYLGSRNPALHLDETLIALSVSAATDENARRAMEQLPKLRTCAVHSSVLLAHVDEKTFSKLHMDLTSEPVFEDKEKIVAAVNKNKGQK